MNKKIVIMLVGIIILLFSFHRIKINRIVSESTYIGKEYCYTYDNKNEHHNKRYYKFYINNEDNTIFCIKDNNKIIKINNIEDLEKLYITRINTVVIDKSNAGEAYDENDNECTSMYLKNRMFPNDESNYWDFIEEE